VKRLAALALVCAWVVPAADGVAKQIPTCGKAKVAKKHRRTVRCALVRRAAARRAAAERLTAVAPAPFRGPSAPAEPGAAPPADGPSARPPLPRSLQVTAREYHFQLSKPEVAAGELKVELLNRGEDPHNLVVSPDDGSHAPLFTWEEAAPNSSLPIRKTITLPGGIYRLWCSILDHEARGMSAQLQVR
jgi:hypothetical protein